MNKLPGKLWTYQQLAELLVCHPRTVARWVKRLKLRIWHPTLNTVRVPDAEVQKLLAQTTTYEQAEFPCDHWFK
jgi:excisionase family DNA binding protein